MRYFLYLFGLVIFVGTSWAIDFDYNDSIIHPLCIALFNDNSSGPAVTQRLSLDACQSAKGNIPVATAPAEGWIRANNPAGGYYQYRVIGQIRKSAFVLETLSSGGGSGQFNNLLILQKKEHITYGFNWQNRKMLPHKELSLTLIARVLGGDRASGGFKKVDLRGNQLVMQRYSPENNPISATRPDVFFTLDLKKLPIEND